MYFGLMKQFGLKMGRFVSLIHLQVQIGKSIRLPNLRHTISKLTRYCKAVSGTCTNQAGSRATSKNWTLLYQLVGVKARQELPETRLLQRVVTFGLGNLGLSGRASESNFETDKRARTQSCISLCTFCMIPWLNSINRAELFAQIFRIRRDVQVFACGALHQLLWRINVPMSMDVFAQPAQQGAEIAARDLRI